MLADRSQFYQDLSAPFFGTNRARSTISPAARDQFWRQGMRVGLKAAHDCIEAFSETDFTDDLKALTVPMLIAQGDDDQIVPIADARTSGTIVPEVLAPFPIILRTADHNPTSSKVRVPMPAAVARRSAGGRQAGGAHRPRPVFAVLGRTDFSTPGRSGAVLRFC